MDPPPPSATTSAKHRLLLELGRGGMGTVYLAVAQGPAGFHKLKVIKRLRADLAHDAQLLQMFLDEARLTARLNHPNVAQTNEIGFDGQHYFIEMEYLEGQSLEAVMRDSSRRGVKLPIGITLYVLAQALAGLHHAHELTDLDGTPLHVVHRDVSPHNILLTYEGAVKVLDFGIAKAADSTSETRTGIVKGKPTYMAPEQAARKPVDRRADVFAVGVILWQALTGRKLWADMNELEIFAHLEHGAIESPRDVSPDVSEELDAICMRALAQYPEDRFSTAAEFQLALEDVLARESERTGSRQLSTYLGSRFGEERAALRAEVEAELKDADQERRAIDVPVVGHSRGPAPIGSTALTSSRTTPGAGAEDGAVPSDNDPERRARRRRVAVWSILAVLAVTAVTIAAIARSFTPRRSVLATAPLIAAPSATPLASEDCALLDDDDVPDAGPDARAAFLVGALLPLGGDERPAGLAARRGLDLARRDFRMVNGLPGATPGAPNRRLAVLVCDSSAAPARAAHHLVRDARVSAVIGFGAEKSAIEALRSELIPGGVLSVVALSESPRLGAVQGDSSGPRLVWRTAVSAPQVAEAIAAIVHDGVERELRAAGAVSDARPFRVAFVRAKDGGALLEPLIAKLSFNGKSVVDNGGAFRALTLGGASDVSAVAGAIAKMRPHAVLYDGEVEIAELIAAVERELSGRDKTTWIGASTPDAAIAAAAQGELRDRLFGVRPRGPGGAYAKLAARLAEQGGVEPNVEPAAAAAYDALYAIAYAAYAAVRDDGSALAAALARFSPPGASFEVGPAHIFDVFAALGRGEAVDLSGAAGSLDFDRDGVAPAVFALVCVGRSGNLVESGAAYDGITRSFSGALRCR